MFARWFSAKKDVSATKKQLQETQPRQWTMDQVQDWLEINDLKDLKPAFAKESMNGEALLELSSDDMVTLGIKKIGHKKKLSKLVQDLQAANPKASTPTTPVNPTTLTKKSSNTSNSKISISDELDNEDSASDELVNAPAKLTVANASQYEVFETFADGVVVMKAKDKQILYVNKTVERMFLYQRNDILGANVKILMAEPHRSKHDGYVDNYLKTGKASIIGQGRMVEARMKDGTLFPLWLSIAESQDDAGAKVFIGTMKDLRNVQLHSKKKVTQMMTLLDNLVDSVIVMNQDCQVMFFNKSAEKIFQYKSDELVGKNINALMPSNIAAVHDNYVKKYMITKQGNVIGKGREVIAKKKDGTLVKIFLSVTETKWDEDPNRISFMGTIQLVSDIKGAIDTTDFTPKQDAIPVDEQQNELFEEVLDIPHAKQMLEKYLKSNQNGEMLQFLDDVQNFRSTKSHKYRFALACTIMNVYVKNESKAELNLPNAQRQELLERFAISTYNEHACPASVFNSVYTAVQVDLVQGVFTTFLQSPEFKTFFSQNSNLFSKRE